MDFGACLCALGLHDFEEEPSRKGPLKILGIDFGPTIFATQKATKNCLRECGKQLPVYREGLVSIVGSSRMEPWRKLSAIKEAFIDRLRTF